MSDMKNIIEVSEETFDEDVLQQSHDIPVVVDFWAPWCGPCRMLGPLLERLASEPDSSIILAKVNVDLNPNLSRHYHVQGIPAVKAFVNGEVVGEFTGAQPEPMVRKFLSQIVPSEMDMLLSEANSMLATHHWSEAEELFRDIAEEYPKQAAANLGLARALLGQGYGCEAEDYLRKCTDGPEFVKAQKLLPLANYLCEIGDPDDEEIEDTERLYRQAAYLFERGNLAAAMDGLLDILRMNKKYKGGQPRLVMLGIFELLGDDDDLTQDYRRELASVLF